jgi:hypothetical protein
MSKVGEQLLIDLRGGSLSKLCIYKYTNSILKYRKAVEVDSRVVR